MSRAKREVGQVIDAVRRMVPISTFELPDEFYPAHLSTALIDAVLRPRLEEGTVTVLDRYCERFGIAGRRREQGALPAASDQETLSALILHYESLGLRTMVREVYRGAGQKQAPTLGNARKVLHAARSLAAMGVERLQDATMDRFDQIEHVLSIRCTWDDSSVRRFLTCIAGGDYVRGDLPVRRFIARALGVEVISSTRAIRLVRAAAYELILAPRFLDYHIWSFSVSEKGSAVLRGEN